MRPTTIRLSPRQSRIFFFFNDTATTEIYTLSLHDALPILPAPPPGSQVRSDPISPTSSRIRSEEHTSELQSRPHLVCRLLLEKKKIKGGKVRLRGDRRGRVVDEDQGGAG